MANSIRYLHKLKITHRDLKLENFMMKNRETWEISLIDFGLSFEWTKNIK
jgi:serine/threonine protein kinase